MDVELQSKGTYVFNFLNDSNIQRSYKSNTVDTISMDKFIGSCTNFETGGKDSLTLEWASPNFSSRIEIGKTAEPGIRIHGQVKNKQGFLSTFNFEAVKFNIMDGAWFFSNDNDETIRIFNNGQIWLDNKLGYFIISPTD